MVQPATPLRSKRLEGPFSRLLKSLRLVNVIRPRIGVYVPSPTISVPDQPGSFSPEIDQPPSIDPEALSEHLVELVSHLRQLLTCEWLEQPVLEVVGEHPIDAGAVADVWIGTTGNRRVIIKSLRCYSSSEYLVTYMVSPPYLESVLLTYSSSAEVL